MPASPTEFFGFSHRPFRGTPDPADYVVVESLDQEVQRLIAAAAQGDGIAVLTAAPGAGKTLACQRLQAELAPRFEAVLISSSGFATRRALLQAVLFALGQSYESSSEQELRLNILNYARTLAATRGGIVLIVDEAHLLNTRLLEELRCLTNHSRSGQPLIRVVLCGQLPLEDALIDPALEALNYRITCHATLEPLSMHESARLIAGRLERAGRSIESIFTPAALETICRVSDGNPRCLVQLCDESLRMAAENSEIPVEAETVREALQQLKQLPLQWNESAIDQPRSTTGSGWNVDPVARPTQQPEDLFDSFDDQAASGHLSDIDEQPLEWSTRVCSVELGAGSEASEALPATVGWSSFEPESLPTPVDANAAAADQQPNDAAACDGGRDEFPLLAPLPDAAREASEASSLVTCEGAPERHDHITETSIPRAQRTRGFVELPVEDVYASLDARTPRKLPLCGADSLEDVLRSSVNCSPRPSRASVREPIEDADPSGQYEPVTAAPTTSGRDRLHSDPVRRLDEVIATLSAMAGQTPDPQSEQDAGWPDGPAWRSAGDCRDYDVIETGGEPQWDDQPDALQNAASMDDTGTSSMPSFRGAAPSSAGQSGSRPHPPRRPYARLFSRARQQQS